MGEINKVAGSFRSSDSKAVSTAKHTFGGRNMLTSLRETTRASEYATPPSKSFVILSSDYLEPYKSQLPKSHSFLSKNRGLGSCYADRDSDTLNNGGGRDRLFAN